MGNRCARALGHWREICFATFAFFAANDYLSDEMKPAVHIQQLPRHEIALWRRQKEHGAD